MTRIVSFLLAAAGIAGVIALRKHLPKELPSFTRAAIPDAGVAVATAPIPKVTIDQTLPTDHIGGLPPGVAFVPTPSLPFDQTPACNEPGVRIFDDEADRGGMVKWIREHQASFSCVAASSYPPVHCCVPHPYQAKAEPPRPAKPKTLVTEWNPLDAVQFADLDSMWMATHPPGELHDAWMKGWCVDDGDGSGKHTCYPHGGHLVEKSEARR